MSTRNYRNRFVELTTALTLILPTIVTLQSAHTQSYPAKPIHMTVPFPPKNMSNATTRLIADTLTKRLKQQIVMKNQPDATDNVADQHVTQSEPDDYTIMLAYNNILTINPFIFTKLPFNVTKNFTPIGKINKYPFIITVNPTIKTKNLQKLIALSKTKPTDLDYETSDTDNNEHLITTLIIGKSKTKLIHVPYKDDRPTMANTMTNHIPISMASITNDTALVKSDKLRAITVSSTEH